ncbi:hypothetical protein KDH83_11785 [Achromobacter sp. Marseille-Q0513]|uniref:hypothetical protein n=1 Tax=Achromobacter sp. Marseille-Q0513 TaxID=2829161 RepID=UPI001B8F8EED|nr:hypothetical protein [Achromobacter sp. Marseille-Q0513]MBR8653984.1 hypothetical protein [Achromobacter sp. Marseille-Q0513]
MKIQHSEPYTPLRARAYPAIGDQLDAIMKFASFLHESGQELPGPVLDWVVQCQGVKQRYPKPVQQPTVLSGGEG